MASTAIGILLGLLVGLRHSFEPDHLTAVSTLVGETRDLRGGAMLGALWGVGHTLSLVAVGAILMAVGASLPERAAVIFELCVAGMLLVLGARAIVVALAATGPTHRHRAGHDHTPPEGRTLARTLAWRPLAVGGVHGLAGSGALTAIAFAELPGAGARLVYMALFGLGSIAGMAVASGTAGVALRVLARSGGARRGLGLITGAVSIVVGVLWAIPLWSRLS